MLCIIYFHPLCLYSNDSYTRLNESSVCKKYDTGTEDEIIVSELLYLFAREIKSACLILN